MKGPTVMSQKTAPPDSETPGMRCNSLINASSGGYDNLMVEASATLLEAGTSFMPLL